MKMEGLEQLDPLFQIHETKVLLVDDNHEIRATLRSLLENEYSHIYEAEDGETAIKLFDLHQPDIVLLDANMPKMSGYEVCEAIKKINPYNIPILILTADESSEAIEKTFSAGATDYVSKHFNWTLLFIRIRILLERYRNERINYYLQKKLAQTQKLQAIGKLTGGIAHDFNNILYSILGYSKLAIEFLNSPNSKMQHFLQEIYHSTIRASELVTQLLTYSGNNKSIEEKIDLNFLLHNTVDRIKFTYPSTINFILDLQFKGTIKGRTLNLSQVLLNICDNARDAMDNIGTITFQLTECKFNNKLIECGSCKELFSFDGIRLTISDTGHGISYQDKEHMFDPFFTNSDLGQKTGLGLSVAHGIIHEMGGHIQVESILDQGTDIHLLLPKID